MRIAALDLATYLPYLPEHLPLRPRAGIVEADLHLRFAQTPQMSVALQGQVRLQGLVATDAAQQEVLRVPALTIDIADLQPLLRSMKLRSVQVTEPWLHLRRDASGRLPLVPQTRFADLDGPTWLAADAEPAINVRNGQLIIAASAAG